MLLRVSTISHTLFQRRFVALETCSYLNPTTCCICMLCSRLEVLANVHVLQCCLITSPLTRTVRLQALTVLMTDIRTAQISGPFTRPQNGIVIYVTHNTDRTTYQTSMYVYCKRSRNFFFSVAKMFRSVSLLSLYCPVCAMTCF